jgi:toxin ParE1/3/4
VTSKPVVPRRQADVDIQEAVDYYLTESGNTIALAFVDALERAIVDIGRHPGIGSPRYAHELNLPGLRHWPVKGFPHLIFYIESERHIEVWRVLHGQRDIPFWMHGQED